MAERKVYRFPVPDASSSRQHEAQVPAMPALGTTGAFSVADRRSSPAVKRIDADLQEDVAEQRAGAFKIGLAQQMVGAIHANGFHVQATVVPAMFAIARSQRDEDAQAILTGVALQSAEMLNTDTAILSRLGAAQITEVATRGLGSGRGRRR